MFAVAREGFAFEAARRLCLGAGWDVVCDDADAGFLQFHLRLGASPDGRRLLSVGASGGEDGPFISLPLCYYDEPGEESSPVDRTPFDAAYQSVSEVAIETLGPAAGTGRYEYPHRPGWFYSYALWRTDEAQVILLQDEHDIQFGMDVSLWLFPAAANVTPPLWS